jgi:hypothetical protein
MEPVTRSGAAAKLRVEKIRMQRMSVKSLVVESLPGESLDKNSKADDERRMVTPWRSRMVRDSGALSTLSPYLIKLFRVGLYDWERLVSFCDKKMTFIPRQRLTGRSVRPPTG